MVQLAEVTASNETVNKTDKAVADEALEKARKAEAEAAIGSSEEDEDDDDDDYEDDAANDDEEDDGIVALANADQTDNDNDDDDDEDRHKFNHEFKETIGERLAALVDVVSPVTRAKVYTTVSKTVEFSVAAVRTVGSGVWVLATAGLLVFLPVVLEVERETAMIQQEHQQRQQQQQAQQIAQAQAQA
ncbi:mitochondrial import receptor subunit Tom22-domain-containing protein [Entophlyctis helioformis]|nr:mitochondrial import receptor subunit Tom22-domain-containing protein [Entophlyctis helioformis]